MKTLIMTVGLPRSGKSTWSRQQDIPIVNPDSIRLALHGDAFIDEAETMVWCMAKYMVKALFITGYEKVILDATNLTRSRRDEWRSRQWNRKFQLFTDVSVSECIHRAEVSGRLDLIPVIIGMASQYEAITPEEELLYERTIHKRT